MILKWFGYSRKPSYERNVGKGSLNFLKADLGWSRFDILLIYHCTLLHVQVLSLLNCPPFRNYLSKGEIALLYLVPYWSTPAKYRTGCVLFMISGGARELGLPIKNSKLLKIPNKRVTTLRERKLKNNKLKLREKKLKYAKNVHVSFPTSRSEFFGVIG